MNTYSKSKIKRWYRNRKREKAHKLILELVETIPKSRLGQLQERKRFDTDSEPSFFGSGFMNYIDDLRSILWNNYIWDNWRVTFKGRFPTSRLERIAPHNTYREKYCSKVMQIISSYYPKFKCPYHLDYRQPHNEEGIRLKFSLGVSLGGCGIDNFRLIPNDWIRKHKWLSDRAGVFLSKYHLLYENQYCELFLVEIEKETHYMVLPKNCTGILKKIHGVGCSFATIDLKDLSWETAISYLTGFVNFDKLCKDVLVNTANKSLGLD